MRNIILLTNYANGDVVELFKISGRWVDVEKLEAFALWSGKKCQDGFDIYQTEYFSSLDEDRAKSAFHALATSDNIHKKTGLGYDLETIIGVEPTLMSIKDMTKFEIARRLHALNIQI